MIDQLHYISQENENTDHIDAILKALNAGARWIQLRVKNQPETTVLELAKAANEHCKKFAARLIINDFPHVAKAISADGIHLGLNDMSIVNARLITGNKTIIGGTANTFEDILQRLQEGADYVGLGPFSFTTTKQQLSPVLGISGYREIMKKVRSAGIKTPVIAIGGICETDLPELLETGIHGVAVSGEITRAGDPSAVVRSMYQQLRKQYSFSNSTSQIC